MEVVKVEKTDRYIINDLLQHHIDIPDGKDSPPPVSHIEKLLNDDRCYLFAAIIDNEVIGYALAYRFPSLYAAENLAYLYDISVNPEHRRKGVGRFLIQTVISHLQADDVKEIWLGTGVENPEGQGLFSATGAVKSEEAFNDYTYYL